MGLALALALGVALALRLFVYPPTGSVGGSDAVVVLAGDASTRLPVATRLAADGAGVLVVSVAGGADNEPARALCSEPGDLEVYCFTAAGADTRAEARSLGALVAEQGWRRITVVTNSYHVVRAGILVRRCTDADVAVADARADMGLRRWASAVVGEAGGLGAAALRQSC
ncbi:conserved exported protein of unknown function [Modestobacter italicus]|uniref:DUF218 domain-containing protein n=1 Tax=Modestobacter italicus (strain DSM 44449 / CECT 9708 / BC 501) TaxID=2732864 RepID=I4EXL1_MODI5|nr:ElyC/SanA/YdcF family protein [Modestobacter marinus]CCH88124.1 conserved exported protein of unknown function [Modestobacter marinus]